MHVRSLENCLSVSQRVCKLPALVQVFASMHARACVCECVSMSTSQKPYLASDQMVYEGRE